MIPSSITLSLNMITMLLLMQSLSIVSTAASSTIADEHDNENNINNSDLENHTDGHDGEDEHHVHDVYAVLLPWFVQALGIIVFYLLTRKLHALPYTAVLFVIGVFMGYGSAARNDDASIDQLTSAIRLWTRIDSEVLFTVFLPGLLFKDALEIDFHLFQASIVQLLFLAFPIVLAGTLLTAVVAMYIFPYDWSFHQCLTFGSILAATDPVAVSALLNEVGAPPRLKVHISGESLLNDGSAVVFFYVFGGLFLHELGIDELGEDSNIAQGFKIFFRMSIGGACVGFAFALGLVLILYKLDRRMEREETVLQVTATVTAAYLSFYTSEVICKMSGVIAVVTCGVATKCFGGGMINDWQVMSSFWDLLEHLLNTLIFALGGIVFGESIQREGLWEARDWGYLIVLYLFANIIRFFLIFAFYPLNRKIGLGTNWREAVFSSWGGLRGAVGITLALALDHFVYSKENVTDDELILTTKMFGMVGGIALMTLVINGTSSGPLLTKLGLGDSTESRQRIVKSAEEAARRRVLDDFLHQMTDKRFYFVDYALVVHHCPLLKDLTSKELQIAIKSNKECVHPSMYKTPNLDHVLPYLKDSVLVRAELEKTKGDFFSTPVTELSALEPTIAEGSGQPDEEDLIDPLQAPPDLIQGTRLMFVELLRAAYTAQVKDGELDPREYDGFLVRALFSSCDFAHDIVSDGEPLSDWKLTDIGATKVVYKTEYFVSRLFNCCCNSNMHEGAKERLETFRDLEPFEYQQLRFDVLRALSFIDAHKEAQDRLEDEFGKETGEAAAAFRVVMGESKAEVRKAEEVLIRKNKKKLNHVISHYLCIILQNKSARYIKQLAESGVLLKKEARHFLEEIDHHIIQIRMCPLDKHPGAIDFVSETTGTHLGIFSPEMEVVQTHSGRPRQRRKRVKQKSIL